MFFLCLFSDITLTSLLLFLSFEIQVFCRAQLLFPEMVLGFRVCLSDPFFSERPDRPVPLRVSARVRGGPLGFLCPTCWIGQSDPCACLGHAGRIVSVSFVRPLRSDSPVLWGSASLIACASGLSDPFFS